MGLSFAMQFKCYKVDTSELEWWRIDYLVCQDKETSPSGNYYVFLYSLHLSFASS